MDEASNNAEGPAELGQPFSPLPWETPGALRFTARSTRGLFIADQSPILARNSEKLFTLDGPMSPLTELSPSPSPSPLPHGIRKGDFRSPDVGPPTEEFLDLLPHSRLRLATVLSFRKPAGAPLGYVVMRALRNLERWTTEHRMVHTITSGDKVLLQLRILQCRGWLEPGVDLVDEFSTKEDVRLRYVRGNTYTEVGHWLALGVGYKGLAIASFLNSYLVLQHI